MIAALHHSLNQGRDIPATEWIALRVIEQTYGLVTRYCSGSYAPPARAAPKFCWHTIWRVPAIRRLWEHRHIRADHLQSWMINRAVYRHLRRLLGGILKA